MTLTKVFYLLGLILICKASFASHSYEQDYLKLDDRLLTKIFNFFSPPPPNEPQGSIISYYLPQKYRHPFRFWV